MEQIALNWAPRRREFTVSELTGQIRGVLGGEFSDVFVSGEISGAQRLPNGNTLITEGVKGNLFEVTSAGEIVWRYVNPVTTTPLAQGATIPTDPGRSDQLMNAVFRVSRYGADYAGLVGRDLTPIGTIETGTAGATMQRRP